MSFALHVPGPQQKPALPLHVVPTPLNTGTKAGGVSLGWQGYGVPGRLASAAHPLHGLHTPPLAAHSASVPPRHAGPVMPPTVTMSGPQHELVAHLHWHCGLTVHVVPSQHAPSLQACRHSASVANGPLVACTDLASPLNGAENVDDFWHGIHPHANDNVIDTSDISPLPESSPCQYLVSGLASKSWVSVVM